MAPIPIQTSYWTGQETFSVRLPAGEAQSMALCSSFRPPTEDGQKQRFILLPARTMVQTPRVVLRLALQAFSTEPPSWVAQTILAPSFSCGGQIRGGKKVFCSVSMGTTDQILRVRCFCVRVRSME